MYRRGPKTEPRGYTTKATLRSELTRQNSGLGEEGSRPVSLFRVHDDVVRGCLVVHWHGLRGDLLVEDPRRWRRWDVLRGHERVCCEHKSGAQHGRGCASVYVRFASASSSSVGPEPEPLDSRSWAAPSLPPRPLPSTLSISIESSNPALFCWKSGPV